MWSGVPWRRAPSRGLVIDNADDPADVFTVDGTPISQGRGWLRPAPAGQLVLITSRVADRQIWGPWVQLNTLGQLDPTDGAHVLLDLAQQAGSLDKAQTAPVSAGCHSPCRATSTTSTVSRFGWVMPCAASPTTGQALTDRFTEVVSPGADSVLDPDGHGLVGRTWEISLARTSPRTGAPGSAASPATCLAQRGTDFPRSSA